MKKQPWIRLPLGDDVSADDVARVAERHGWPLLRRIPRGEDNPGEIVWATPAGQATIHHFDDQLIGLRYVMVIGGSDEEPARLARTLRDKLHVLERDDIERLLAATAPSALERAVRLLAVSAPAHFDARWFRRLEPMLFHREAIVRRTAILGIGYLGWPEFAAPLARVAASDQDAGVRHDAAAMLEGYRRFEIGPENPLQPFLGNSGQPAPGEGAAPASRRRRPRHSLIFKERDVRERFAAFAGQCGWREVGRQDPDVAAFIAFEIAWLTPDGETAVHYLEDWHIFDGSVSAFSLERPFVVIEGDDTEAWDARIAGAFAMYSKQELVEQFFHGTDTKQRIHALTCLSYMTPDEPDEDYVRVVESAMKESDVWLRLAATEVLRGALWPVFRELVDRVRVEDPSGDVRREASQIRGMYEIDVDEVAIDTLLDVWGAAPPAATSEASVWSKLHSRSPG